MPFHMAKKAQYGKQAENLFVREGLTLTDIAQKIPVSYVTLREWKKQGKWEVQRNEFKLAAQACHLELYDLLRILAKKLRQDEEKGEKITPARYFALGRLIDALMKTHAYEEKTAKERAKAGADNAEEKKKIASAEIEKWLFGGANEK